MGGNHKRYPESARFTAVVFMAAGSGMAILLASAGWALAALVIWVVTTVIGINMVRKEAAGTTPKEG